MKLMTAKEAYEITMRNGIIKRIANAIVNAIDNESFSCCVSIEDFLSDDIEFIKELLKDAQYDYTIENYDNYDKLLFISWHNGYKTK